MKFQIYALPNVLLISGKFTAIALHIYYIGHACANQFHNSTTPGEYYHQTSNTRAPNAKT